MTTATADFGNLFGRSDRSARARRLWRGRMMRRALIADVPISDWIALALLAWMLSMVGWSVQLANWGELPNIVPTALIAAAVAFLMSRIDAPRTRNAAYWSVLLKAVAFIVLGVLIVFWQGGLNGEGNNPIERSIDAWDRLGIWIDIAINGGVSADQLPFAMIMMSVAWILGYAVTTLTFRYRSPWIPALMLGLALLTNLSHRIGMHEQTFYLFMLAAVAQFAHLVAIGRIDQWRKSGLTFPKEARWIAARDGLILGFAVMIIAALMPMFLPRSEALSVRWNAVLLDPITQFKDTAERLLAGVPSGESDQIYSPNAILPFQGGINLTDDPVMWIRSRYAKLHPARVYQEYSSQGWLTAPSVSIPADASTKLLVDPAENGIAERTRTDISVELLGKTDLVVPAAAVYAVDYASDVEILEPIAWDVPLAGSPAQLAELPEDLRQFAFSLRERLLIFAQDSPTYSPPATANDREPLTLNTQPAMTFDEVSSVIRQMQSGVDPITNISEQITYSITSSALEELNLSTTGEFLDMTFNISETALFEMFDDRDATPETVGLRVSTVALREHAEENNGLGPAKLEFVIAIEDLISMSTEVTGVPGTTGLIFVPQFRITAEDIEAMDLSRSGIEWDSFNYRVFSEPDGTNANLMRLVRRGPTEQNTVTFDKILEPEQRYAVSTYISTAESAQLAQSTDDYPDWITDRYLQLPDSLPRQVRNLARSIVDAADAETPWQKTLAIKEWLQSQVYSLEIKGPGARDDGVHYFLFKTMNEPCPSDKPDCDTSKRKGYSQYFGSAATVMLRSVGVPARMVAGWSAGEYVPEQGQFIIRDRNRHGWTQVFAPPYGWIDVEVTPGRAAVPRNVLVPTTPTNQFPPELMGSSEFDPDYLEYLEDLDELAMLEQQMRAAGGFRSAAQEQSGFQIPIIPTASAASALVIILFGVAAWRWNLRGQPEPIRAYTQFVRIATILGYRRPSHESAREFTTEIAQMTGRYAEARLIIREFENAVYGPKLTETPEDSDSQGETVAENAEEYSQSTSDQEDISESTDPKQTRPELGKAWRTLSRATLKHRVATMFGMTPAYTPEEAQQQYRYRE